MRALKNAIPKKIIVGIFFIISRLITRISRYIVIYNWPEKKIIFGEKITHSLLKSFLHDLWPVNIDGGLTRFGTSGDGGYLIPNKSKIFNVCFSAGVEHNSDFEYDLYKRYDCTIHMLDGSVDGPAVHCDNFYFQKKWLGIAESDNTVEVNSWISLNANSHDRIILKLDIEGCEYRILDALEDNLLSKIDCIVCEFHSFESIILREEIMQRKIIKKLLEKFYCVHLHPNNGKRPFLVYGLNIPSDIEVTFIRKDLVTRIDGQVLLPNILDFDNTTNQTTILNWT